MFDKGSLNLVLLAIIFLFIINHRFMNNQIGKLLGKHNVDKETEKEELDSLVHVLRENGIRIFLFMLPIIILIYYDMKYPNLFIKESKLGKVIGLKKVMYVLKILGAYGIIQILAQDMGLKTGYVQRELVQSRTVQFFVFTGTAFTLTNDISQAVMGTLIYFTLKYGVSNNLTSTVCFERT